MTTIGFLKTLEHKQVDLYCKGADWLSGRLEECSEKTITLKRQEGTLTIDSESILSATTH